MLGVLLDGTVIRLVAMNQTSKAVILIVYRFSGGYVKLFRQISFSIVKILVLGSSVPGFFGDPAQRIVGVADLCTVAVGHGAKVRVLRSIIIAGQLSAAHGNAGHVAEAIVAHMIILSLLRAARRNITAAPHCNQVAAGVFITGRDYSANIIRLWPVIFGEVTMSVCRSVWIHLSG